MPNKATEAIRTLLLADIDQAAVSTILRCTFREVQQVKATLDAEALVETRKKSALAMHAISPEVEDRRVAKEHGLSLGKMARGDRKHESRINRSVGHGFGMVAENVIHREDIGNVPRGHGYETGEE